MPRFIQKTCVISAGQSLSAVLDCTTGAPAFLYLPDQWTPAQISFQVSSDGTNFKDLFDADNREIQFNVHAGSAILINPEWIPIVYLKIRSGGRDLPVVQTDDRVFTMTLDTKAAA